VLRSISNANSKELSSLLGRLIDGKHAARSATCLALELSVEGLLLPHKNDIFQKVLLAESSIPSMKVCEFVMM